MPLCQGSPLLLQNLILILPREKPLPKENLGFMASRTALEQSPLHAKPEGSKPGSPAAHDLGIVALLTLSLRFLVTYIISGIDSTDLGH